MGKRQIKSEIIESMRENGWLQADWFQLKNGFNTTYEVKNVRDTKSRGSKVVDSFTLECKSELGHANISGSAFANARVLDNAAIDAESVAEFDGVYNEEDIQDSINNAIRMNSRFEEGEEYSIPKKIKIVGVGVRMGEDGNPEVPMSRYEHYQKVLAHHRKVVGDDEAFMRREEFADYLAATGDDRPAGVPETATKMQLPKGIKADDPRNWRTTLLLADVSE